MPDRADFHLNQDEPEKLADILVKSFASIFTDDVYVGGGYELTDNPNMNVYALDVEGMKQVRWPGVNNA